MKIQSLLCVGLFGLCLPLAQAKSTGASIAVTLSPAGSYKAETPSVKGTALKHKDGSVTAKEIIVDLSTLKTGIGLRDKHTKERLKADKFPTAKLLEAKGKDGKGEATIEVMGKQKKVSGTYKIEGNSLVSEFPMSLAELDIKDVRYMGVGVKDQIVVTIVVPAKAAP